MKIHYLGTAAAERIPALFCNCEVCNHARKFGGKNLRTQTQTLIDDGQLMIDFPGDSYLHLRMAQINYNEMRHLLITHWHSDHLYAEDLAYRMSGYANGINSKMTVYGSEAVRVFFDRAFELEGKTESNRIEFEVLEPYTEYLINGYAVYPIPALHGNFNEDCFIYLIKKEDKAFLYTHDTGFLTETAFDFLERTMIHINAVSLDCTGQIQEDSGSSHMNIHDNVRLIKELKKRNICNESTIFIANHFSHNGGLNFEQMSEVSEKFGIRTSYDGMKISI